MHFFSFFRFFFLHPDTSFLSHFISLKSIKTNREVKILLYIYTTTLSDLDFRSVIKNEYLQRFSLCIKFSVGGRRTRIYFGRFFV